jgi:hypothetical protein
MGSKRKTRPDESGFIPGWDAFTRLSAVEGIMIGPDVEALFRKFDRAGLSQDERRREAFRMFAHKS